MKNSLTIICLVLFALIFFMGCSSDDGEESIVIPNFACTFTSVGGTSFTAGSDVEFTARAVHPTLTEGTMGRWEYSTDPPDFATWNTASEGTGTHDLPGPAGVFEMAHNYDVSFSTSGLSAGQVRVLIEVNDGSVSTECYVDITLT
ncbi:hypothetical protein ACFLRA_03965 [Bdellovibrionota bacterium]